MVVATNVVGLFYRQAVESVYPLEFRIDSRMRDAKNIDDIAVLRTELSSSPLATGLVYALPNHTVPVPTAVRFRYTYYTVEWKIITICSETQNLGTCVELSIGVDYKGFYFTTGRRFTTLIGYLVDEGVLVMDYRSRYEEPIKALSFNMFGLIL
jgi:hypothetical protein